MPPTSWIAIAGFVLTVIGALAACIGILLRLTWQASALMSRVISIEAQGLARDVKLEEAHRAVGCVVQLESEYVRMRETILQNSEHILELRIRAGVHEDMNGKAQ